MLSVYLPTVVAIIAAAITVYGNIRAARIKATVDSKVIMSTANDALRDDLQNLVARSDKREEFLLAQLAKSTEYNEKLQTTVSALREEVSELRIENKSLKAELQKTRRDLEAFDKKVYYVKDKTGEVQQ